MARRSGLRRHRRAQVLVVPLVGLALVLAALPGATSTSLDNLVVNPSVELDTDGDGLPDGFLAAGYGDNQYFFRRITDAYVGRYALELTITSWTDGDRKLLASIGGPAVIPGHRYSLSTLYRSSVHAFRTAFLRRGSGDWTFWFSGPVAPPTTTWLGAPFVTPPVPEGVTEIGFGLALASVGTIITDAYTGFDIDSPSATTTTTTTTTRPTTTTTRPTTTTTRPTTTTTTPPAPPATPWATTGERELHVSPAGSDSGTGARDRPFRQIQKAAEAATPGTIVRVAPGDYGPVIVRTGGAAGRPITFLAEPLGAARINQTGIDPAWLNFSSYVDIVGFDLQAPRAHQGINNRGSYVRAFHNHVHNVFTQGSCTGGAAINHELYTGTGNAAIGNTIHEVGPVGCSLVHGVYISNNTFVVQNNLVYDVSGWLLHFYHATDRGTVTNNTMFAGSTPRAAQTDGGISLCADEGNIKPADDFVVTNNIIRDVYVGIAECGQMGTHIGPNNIFENNLIYNVAVPSSLRNPIRGTITSDPLFVDWQPAGNGDYRLARSSPAVDSGTHRGAPDFDRLLSVRPKPPAMDRGAYEGGF